MPPQPEWFAGREAVGRFLASLLAADRRYRLLPLGANAGPAVAVYRRMTSNAAYEAAGIILLAIRGGRVAQMTRFTFPRLFPLFGLPAHLPSGGLDVSGS
jgi:RNA polymerase sigma-70 factor (ECF subfamily)